MVYYSHFKTLFYLTKTQILNPYSNIISTLHFQLMCQKHQQYELKRDTSNYHQRDEISKRLFNL